MHAWLATPVPNPRDLRAEFLAKVYLGRLTGAPEVAELLRGQRHVLQERLERLKDNLGRTDFVRHVYALRTLQTQAALEWLSELEAEDVSTPDLGAEGAQAEDRARRIHVRAGGAPREGLPGAGFR